MNEDNKIGKWYPCDSGDVEYLAISRNWLSSFVSGTMCEKAWVTVK
jgi:hypothetical protein